MVAEIATQTSIGLLMLLVAVLVALVGSLLYLTLEFNYRLERPAAPRTVAPLARVKTRND